MVFALHGSGVGELTINDSIQGIGSNPHSGSPVAHISQGVIELVRSITGNLGRISYARIGKSETNLSIVA
jgi:hypothetical protein